MSTKTPLLRTGTRLLTPEETDALFGNLPVVMLHFDAAGRCVNATPSAQMAPALEGAALVGQNLDALITYGAPTADRSGEDADRPVVLHAGGRDHHMTGVQVRTESGVLLALRAETAAEAEQRVNFFLPEIARRTRNIVAVTDANRRLIWVNEAFEKRTGYARDEVIGKRPADLVQFEGTDKATVARIAAAVRRREPVEAEILNRSKQGDEYWLSLDIQPLFGPDGALRGYMGVQTDVTTLKALTQQAERATREARSRTRELQKSQIRLRDAVDALPYGFAMYDSDLKLIIGNPMFRELVRGEGKAVVPGATYETVMREIAQTGGFPETAAEQDQWVRDKIDAIAGDISKWQYFNGKCGKWVEAIDKHIPNGGLVSLRIDITALKEAGERLATIIEGAGVGTWAWHAATGASKIDERWAAMLGHEAGELGTISDERLADMIHPDDRARTLAMWDRINRGDVDQCETVFRLPHRDGHWVSILSRAIVTHRDAAGRPETVSGVHIDVTEHRAREAALRQALRDRDVAEQRFFDIANVSDDWLWEQDEHMRFSWISESITRILGLPLDEIIGRTRDEIAGDDPYTRDAIDWEPLRALIAARQPFRDIQYPLYSRSAGKHVWLRVNGAPIFDPEGNFRGYRGNGSDVTALIEARERAEEASRTKSLFLANMSHEIRTPLNGVLGMAELLESQMTDPENKHMVGIIRKSGESLLSILNDILDMSKIEAGRLELETLPFRPADLAEALENLHALKAQEKGLGFEVLSGGGAQKFRLGDANRVRQILNNLIGNAIKFTETGEVVVTIGARRGDDLTIEVRDTGIGMNGEQKDRLFQDFSQADASITRRFGGTGLGLAIVKRLVEMMGGQVVVQSAPGEGTQISVSLPLAECAPPEPSRGDAGIAAAMEQRLDGVRILAADDNETNRLLLGTVLKKFGAEVTQVANGAQAVETWAPDRFDVLILDISMPVMDGIEALRQIQERAAQTSREPVRAIAFTANAMAHQVVEYIGAGFATHVPKPFRAAELVKAIVAILPQRG